MTHPHTESKEPESTSDDSVKPTASPKKPQMEKGRIIFYGAIAGFLLVIVGLSAVVYSSPVTQPVVRAITSVIPYPAFVIGNEVVTYDEFLVEYDSLVAYLNSGETEAKVDFSEEVTEALINKIATQHLAAELDIELDSEREEAMFGQVLYGLSGEEEFAAELKKELGWTVEEFKERVVRPVTLASQVHEYLLNDEEIQTDRRQQADAAYQRLGDGETFDVISGEIAEQYDFPVWKDAEFEKLNAYPTDWQAVISDLENGDVSQVFSADGVFVIARLDEKIDAGSDTEIKLSVIAVPKKGLEDVVNQRLEETRVWRLVQKI